MLRSRTALHLTAKLVADGLPRSQMSNMPRSQGCCLQERIGSGAGMVSHELSVERQRAEGLGIALETVKRERDGALTELHRLQNQHEQTASLQAPSPKSTAVIPNGHHAESKQYRNIQHA